MPVNSRHPEYSANLRRWRISRAVCEGEDAVKDIGTGGGISNRVFGPSPTSSTGSEQLNAAIGPMQAAGGVSGDGVSWELLPPLSGHQSVGEYWSYVRHAHFFPAAGRARDGLVGLLVKDEVAVTNPTVMEAFVSDVTSSGSPMTVDEFCGQVIFEIITTGRAGVLTDYPPRPKGPDGTPAPTPNLLQAEISGIKPRWKLYRAEQMINWRMDRVRGREILGMVVIEEPTVVPPPADAVDEFEWIQVRQWRVLDRAIPPQELAGKLPIESTYGDRKAYRVRFFTLDSENNFVQSPPVFPTVNGRLSEEIPFEFIGARDCSPVCDKPPLYDVVTVNVGHYRNSAALEHALFFCANPMGYVFGYDPEEELGGTEAGAQITSRPNLTFRFGSPRLLTLKNANAKAGMLSARAADVSALSDRIQVKRDEMASLVGRILATEKKAAEAALTEKVRRQGEQGVLSSIAANVSAALTRCMMRARDYMGAKGDVEIAVPTQFWDTGITAVEATAIADLWMKYGVIAKSDVRQQLRDSGFVTRSDEDIDAELALEPVPTAPAGFLPFGAMAGVTPALAQPVPEPSPTPGPASPPAPPAAKTGKAAS